MTDTSTLESPYVTAPGAITEPAAGGGDGFAFVFGATCAGLQAWSRSLGFEAIALGVAADVREAVARLGADGYGGGGMTLDVIQADVIPWRDWRLVPIAGSVPASHLVQAQDGAYRVRLPEGCGVRLLAGRFAALMLPMEAARLGASASSAAAREDVGAMPPASPRFTRTPAGWMPAHGLYRWADPGDADRLDRAVSAALSSLLFARHELDVIAEADTG